MTDEKRRANLQKAIKELKKTTEGYNPKGEHWRTVMALLNELAASFEPEPMPLLGPVTEGGASLLKMSLTHNTDGLELYPAVDVSFSAGSKIICPEAGKVTKLSGNDNGGYSVYITGKSGLKYYFQHLYSAGRPKVGAIARGAKIGNVGSPSKFPAQRVAHCHLGVNAESELGKGKQLKYGKNGNGPDYTLGAPSIGSQL